MPEVFYFIPQWLSLMIARLFYLKLEDDAKRDALNRLVRTTQQRQDDTLTFL